MNLVLTFCWREWRAQRALLVAYTVMVFAGLALGLWLTPRHIWTDETFGAHALTWFVAAGVIGVVLFAVPQLVRDEFGAKDDLFVRRLPGALLPSFLGKLLFFTLVAVAMPVLGLAVGELYVTLRGATWDGLFTWWWDGSVTFGGNATLVACGLALLASTWVWAVGTWLPGGRMAIGGTVLLALLLSIGLVAVLRQSPGLEKDLPWHGWLGYLPAAGLGVVAASWLLGRRGGGPLRSARFGLAAVAVAAVPPGSWLAVQAWHYHHPDLQQLERCDVRGLSPDGRFAVAVGNVSYDYETVPLRIDLATGEAEQLGSIRAHLDTELLWVHHWTGNQGRWWRLYDYETGGETLLRHELLDLVTGTRCTVPWSTKTYRAELDAAQTTAVAAEQRALSPFRAPGGSLVWFEDQAACFANADGTVDRVALPGLRSVGRAIGHGASVWLGPDANRQVLDFTSRRLLPARAEDSRLFIVRGRQVYELSKANVQVGKWLEADEDQPEAEVAGLKGAYVLGLYDDDRLLCEQHFVRGVTTPRLFLYDVAARTRSDLAWPADAPSNGRADFAAQFLGMQSLLPRDPAGRIWLATSRHDRAAFVLLDTATATLRTVLPHDGWWRHEYHLLAWLDADTILVQSGARILRVAVATGAVRQLFPRP